jgi:hypothetical protein
MANTYRIQRIAEAKARNKALLVILADTIAQGYDKSYIEGGCVWRRCSHCGDVYYNDEGHEDACPNKQAR